MWVSLPYGLYNKKSPRVRAVSLRFSWSGRKDCGQALPPPRLRRKSPALPGARTQNLFESAVRMNNMRTPAGDVQRIATRTTLSHALHLSVVAASGAREQEVGQSVGHILGRRR
jgi:hypothetical protein